MRVMFVMLTYLCSFVFSLCELTSSFAAVDDTSLGRWKVPHMITFFYIAGSQFLEAEETLSELSTLRSTCGFLIQILFVEA